MSELNWDWPEIAVMLVQKLAPGGVVVTRQDLGSLPMDRVPVEERLEDRITYRWMCPADAKAHAKRIRQKTGEKVGLQQLQGRWQKLAFVLLWKLAKDGCVLMNYDRDAVPADKVLMAHGHKDDIEYRFVPRAEAARIQKWEKEHEGKTVMEAM
jgi:hypothetical protein